MWVFVPCELLDVSHLPTVRPGAVASLLPRLRFNFDAVWFAQQASMAMDVGCDWFMLAAQTGVS